MDESVPAEWFLHEHVSKLRTESENAVNLKFAVSMGISSGLGSLYRYPAAPTRVLENLARSDATASVQALEKLVVAPPPMLGRCGCAVQTTAVA
jgi:hypothetical protein